jgi:SAM-dependent methyltransferase
MAATREEARLPRLARRERRRLRFLTGQVRVRVNRLRLLRSLPRNAVGAEIGVWKGDGARAILRHARPKLLFLVDPWQHQPELARARYGKDGQAAMDAIHSGVLERFDSEIREGRVKVLRNRSDEVWESFEDSSLDFVWLDGDHTYDAVKRDLQALTRIVKPGGFIVGDDYTYGWWGDSVIKAVDEFVEAGNGTLRVVGELHFAIQLAPRAPTQTS